MPTMTLKELFDFVVDPNIVESTREKHLDRLRDAAANRDPHNLTQQERMEEEFFKKVYIPKTFNQVSGNYLKEIFSYRIKGVPIGS